ncbi:MAG: hypothetical protein K2N63_02600 [Lachnospiraceae bacterium]|nr:hypothetical protein [Lachnospiraceae bacterium]
MFKSGHGTIQMIAEQLQISEDKYAFSQAVKDLRELLIQVGVNKESLLKLEQRAYYPVNNYSDRDTKEKMQQAKERVLAYVDELMDGERGGTQMLEGILKNFYFFLEALLEREPHKKSGIQKVQLENLKITNEYDIQHLLYAYLKPLYPAVRAEVSEDTGYHLVRVDIAISADCVIEVKCTRRGMKVNKLLEEIEADMVHYHAKEIYFFIYDKEKMIENPIAFQDSIKGKIQGKEIHTIIHQPKIL